MQNYIAPGDTMEVALGSGETGVSAGDAYLVGDRVGVVASLTRNGQTVFANQASAEGDIAIVRTRGVYSLPKEAPLVIDQGDLLYWDDSEGEVTKTATDNTVIGFAFTGAVSAAVTVEVDLTPGVVVSA